MKLEDRPTDMVAFGHGAAVFSAIMGGSFLALIQLATWIEKYHPNLFASPQETSGGHEAVLFGAGFCLVTAVGILAFEMAGKTYRLVLEKKRSGTATFFGQVFGIAAFGTIAAAGILVAAAILFVAYAIYVMCIFSVVVLLAAIAGTR